MNILCVNDEDKVIGTYNGKDIIFMKNEKSEMMISMGMAICCVAPFMFNDEKKYIILHDNTFDKLPKKVQDMFVQHEIGHVMNGDLENITVLKSLGMILLRTIGIIPKMEIDADEYAAKQLGFDLAVKTLIYSSKHAGSLSAMGKLEMKRRANYLKIKKLVNRIIK